MTKNFEEQVQDNIRNLSHESGLIESSRDWIYRVARHGYTYNFNWMGRPIIQFPQDMTAMQELVWKIKPDLIIETGIAHGGSLVMNASLLALLDMCDAIHTGAVFDYKNPKRKVIGIDIDIRPHNRAAIEAHPLFSWISLIQGSSIDSNIVAEVRRQARGYKTVLVSLDSNHTHDHVLAELEAYAPLTTAGSYCVVFDTLIEYAPDDLVNKRPWHKGNSPLSAIKKYLSGHPEFEIDVMMDHKLQITGAPEGYLRRIQ